MNAERTGSVFWLLVGAAALHGGIDLGLGSTAEPGPGFLAVVAGAFVALMALILSCSHCAQIRLRVLGYRPCGPM